MSSAAAEASSRVAQAKTGCQINVDESGNIEIAAPNANMGAACRRMIEELTAEPEPGRIYKGRVKTIQPFGAFVEIPVLFEVTDATASYGSSNYITAISQLAQTTLRSVIGKLELDKTFEERDIINAQVVQAIDEAALNWGVKVLRYEIKDLTPPKEILHAMQQQITAEREKRALIAASEGYGKSRSVIATGEREAFIARSEAKNKLPSTTHRVRQPPFWRWPRPMLKRLNARGSRHSSTRRGTSGNLLWLKAVADAYGLLCHRFIL